MCGIGAIISLNEEQVRNGLPRMIVAMRHRGPDANGSVLLNLPEVCCGLASTRLAILDLSPAGAQPMVCPKTGATLVFNGEIFNHLELRRELLDAGVEFQGTSDTEVVLNGLVRWGTDFFSRLKGMFALAFVDGERKALLLARDPLGIKPLYQHSRSNLLVIGSEVQAVVAGALLSREVDAQGLISYLAYGAIAEPRTIFKEVRMFPRGSFQVIPLARQSLADPTPPKRFFNMPAIRAISEPEAIAQVRGTLTQAVEQHLISHVPVGILLSSGVDSTIVANLAAESAPQMRSFTVGLAENSSESESDLAQRTAKRLGLRHSNIVIGPDEVQAEAEAWLDSLDQPSIDGLNVFVISRAIHAQGIKVALSGQGGDELFGGYPSFGDVERMRSLFGKFWFLPRLVRRSGVQLALFTKSAAVRAKAIDIVESNGDVLSLYLQRRRTLSSEQLKELGINGFLRSTPNFLPPEAGPSFEFESLCVPEAVSLLETHYYLGNMLLRDGDANSMAHSLELRMPFLDTRVIEMAFAIPARIRFPKGARAKHLLRAAFPEALPGDVAMQAKKGFTLPINRWMTGALRGRCEAGLEYLRQTRLLNNHGIDTIWSQFLLEPRSPAWSRAWELCVLGIFAEKHSISSV
jgi:asparagine synthase (glutamine-hydrolysing)